jgi:hypothetical protein
MYMRYDVVVVCMSESWLVREREKNLCIQIRHSIERQSKALQNHHVQHECTIVKN